MRKIAVVSRWSAIATPLAAMGLLLATSAVAQDVSTRKTPDDSSQWIVTLGGTAEFGPAYEGSDKGSFSVLPSFDIRRLGEPVGLSAPDDNFDYTLLDFNHVEIGPVVGIRDGRSSADDLRLRGLDRIHWGLDAGAFVQYWPVEDQLRFRIEARQGLRSGDGLVADFSVDWFQPVTDNLTLSAGPRVSVANRSYMRRTFGISERESAANGRLAAFDIGGGVKSVGVTLAATYTFSPEWSVEIYDRYDRLTGAAADSPIASGFGTRNQNTIGISLNRSFQIGF